MRHFFSKMAMQKYMCLYMKNNSSIWYTYLTVKTEVFKH
jgi:hypothetical protein